MTPPATPEESDNESETVTKVLDLPTIPKYGKSCEEEDETLEILMTDLEEKNAKQFYLDHASAVAEDRYFKQPRKQDLSDSYDDVFSNASGSADGEFTSEDEGPPYPQELTTEGHALGTVVSETCGLSDLYHVGKYPEAKVDAYLFTPCGFSANGVIPTPNSPKDTHYFTVHVTPEPICSFASFETNVPARQTGRETTDVINQVVNIFKPGRFSVTLFEAKPSSEETDALRDAGEMDALHEIKALERQATRRSSKMDSIKGYRRVDRIVHDLDGYDLVFRYYERNDWKGGAPRIGESSF